jgi:hypothetical membrane protein
MRREYLMPRISGLAGILGPSTFILVFTILGQFSPGYSPTSDVISNLELVPNGWIQQLNFLQCGTSIIVFTLGFRKAMLNTIKRLRISTALLIVSGAGMIDASIFTPAFPVEHVVGGFLLFIFPLLAAFFLLGRQLIVGGLRNLGSYSLAAGCVTLILLLVFLFSMGASTGVSANPTGVLNRLFVVAALAWFLVMGASLLKSHLSRSSA